jgi:hypothetical protein
MRRTFPLLLALSFACTSMQGAGDSTDVSLRAAADPGRAGGITLTLHNDSNQSIGYNLCSSSLEQRSGESWTAVREDRACTMELRTLEPGAQTTESMMLPPGTSSGEFRYTTSIEFMEAGERVTVSSNPITVGA